MPLVGREGLEPSCLATYGPEPYVSTSSTTCPKSDAGYSLNARGQKRHRKARTLAEKEETIRNWCYREYSIGIEKKQVGCRVNCRGGCSNRYGDSRPFFQLSPKRKLFSERIKNLFVAKHSYPIVFKFRFWSKLGSFVLFFVGAYSHSACKVNKVNTGFYTFIS